MNSGVSGVSEKRGRGSEGESERARTKVCGNGNVKVHVQQESESESVSVSERGRANGRGPTDITTQAGANMFLSRDVGKHRSTCVFPSSLPRVRCSLSPTDNSERATSKWQGEREMI